MDSLKTWLIEVAVKKMGPSAIRAAILAAGGFVAAREGLFAQFGVVYDAVAQTITIHLDTLNSAATLYLIGTAGAGGAIIKMLNHHADVIVKGNPSTANPT